MYTEPTLSYEIIQVYEMWNLNTEIHESVRIAIQYL